ncbi:hypothetical protein GGGNBK_17705 [Sporosarcina sp. ANT_H38]
MKLQWMDSEIDKNATTRNLCCGILLFLSGGLTKIKVLINFNYRARFMDSRSLNGY